MKPYWVGAITLLLTSSAQAHSCWINKVSASNDGGILIMLDEAPSGFRITRGRADTFYVLRDRHYQALDSHSNPTGPILDALPMSMGDTFFGWNTPEDTCSATVVIRDGQIGLDASYGLPTLPGQRGETVSPHGAEFIPIDEEPAAPVTSSAYKPLPLPKIYKSPFGKGIGF